MSGELNVTHISMCWSALCGRKSDSSRLPDPRDR